MTDSVLGMASAKSEALKMGKRNIEVSAPMIIELVDRIEELEKLIGEKESLKRDALVMANARRLIKANKRTSNGRLYMEIFGTGCGTGRAGARLLGLDPDSNETSYNDMCDHIEQGA